MRTVEVMRALQIFYCYAHDDKEFLNDLERHLGALRRSKQIITWFDREIQPGSDWAQEIDLHLDTADIVLLVRNTINSPPPTHKCARGLSLNG